MKKILMLTAVALIFQVTPVLAEDHGGDHSGKKDRGSKMFDGQDTDGDDAISQSEFLASAKKKFAKMDLNGDGSITKDEAKAGHESRRDKMREMKKKRGDKSDKRRGEDRPEADAESDD